MASWGPPGPLLGASWALLGPSWNPIGPLLGLSWAILGQSWGHLEASETHRKRKGENAKHRGFRQVFEGLWLLGGFLGRLEGHLEFKRGLKASKACECSPHVPRLLGSSCRRPICLYRTRYTIVWGNRAPLLWPCTPSTLRSHVLLIFFVVVLCLFIARILGTCTFFGIPLLASCSPCHFRLGRGAGYILWLALAIVPLFYGALRWTAIPGVLPIAPSSLRGSEPGHGLTCEAQGLVDGRVGKLVYSTAMGHCAPTYHRNAPSGNKLVDSFADPVTDGRVSDYRA